MQNEGERLRYIEEMIQELAQLEQSVEREHYVRQLSEEFQLSIDVLYQEIQRKEQQVQKEAWKHQQPKVQAASQTKRRDQSSAL